MKKFLTGILALSLLSIASVAFAQKVGICEQAGYTWSVEQGKCVPSSAEHPCNKDCVYSEEEGKCVCKQTNKMCKGNYVWNETLGECVALTCKTPAVWSDIQQACVIPSVQDKCKNSQVWDAELGQCVNPDEQEESEREELVNVPELKNCARGSLNSEKFPCLKYVFHVGQEKHRGMYNTNELILLGMNYDDDEYQKVKDAVTQNDVINMQYTSGTEGFPKGVMLTSRNIVNDGFYIGENMNYTEKDRLLLQVPLFHCFGTVLGVMAVITHGSTMIMLEEYDPLLAISSIQKEKCTSIYGVPTMFIGMMNHPMFDMFDMSSLRTGIMAGSTCPVETMKDAIEKMNMKEITSVYGLTEAAPGFTQTNASDSFEKKINTVGRKFPNIEVKIVDPETGEELGPGETGEIMCRGFNVMKGYYNMPEKTAETIEPDGWLHSGDLATVDEEGYYSIVGRIKDMIIRGGENIYPREIEEFLFTHECVQDVQVAGIPDEKYGEIVGAFIIKEEGFDDVTEADIRDFCIGSIARYKVPKYVFFVEEFPLTTSGKIQKYKLGDLGLKLLDERKAKGEL